MAIKDLLKELLTNPTNLAEIITLLVSLLLVRSRPAGFWRWFVVFMTITLLVETSACYYRLQYGKSNHSFYNAFMIVQAAFYFFLFLKFFSPSQIRLLFSLLLLVFVLFFLGESVLLKFAGYNLWSRQFLSVYVVLGCCLYYTQLLRQEGTTSPLREPIFWIITGLFAFYFGSIVTFSIYFPLSGEVRLHYRWFYNTVIGTLSCILYCSWIIGFICRRRHLRL